MHMHIRTVNDIIIINDIITSEDPSDVLESDASSETSRLILSSSQCRTTMSQSHLRLKQREKEKNKGPERGYARRVCSPLWRQSRHQSSEYSRPVFQDISLLDRVYFY